MSLYPLLFTAINTHIGNSPESRKILRLFPNATTPYSRVGYRTVVPVYLLRPFRQKSRLASPPYIKVYLLHRRKCFGLQGASNTGKRRYSTMSLCRKDWRSCQECVSSRSASLTSLNISCIYSHCSL